MRKTERRNIMSDTTFFIIGIVLVGLGLLLLWGAIGRNLTCSQKVIAKVIDVKTDEAHYWKGTLPHYPTFTYVVNGRKYTVESKEYTRSMDKYREDEEAVIWCNPRNPEEIRLGVSIGGFLVALVPLLIGGLLIYVYVRYV